MFEESSFLRGIPKGFLAICKTASEISGPGANTGLISSAFFIGLRGAHASWDATPIELVELELEPLKIKIPHMPFLTSSVLGSLNFKRDYLCSLQ